MAVTVTWPPNPESDLASYDIQRAPASTGTFVDVTSIAHNFAGANYENGEFFYVDAAGTIADWYRIRAVDNEAQASAWSEVFQASETISQLTRVLIRGPILTPDGEPLTSGYVEVRLSQAGSAMDGASSVRIAGGSRVSAIFTLSTGGLLPGTARLVPNDVITPSGTYYRVRVVGVSPDSQLPVIWEERWQLASTPDPVDVGAVPRLDAVPGTVITTAWNQYDLLLFASGKPGASQTIARVVMPRQVTIPAGAAASRCDVGVNPTAEATLTIQRNGTPVGTVTISTGGVATFAVAAAVVLAAGDVLSVEAQAVPDATLADISLTLVGSM